jgi:hypothetical protein
VPVGPSSAYTNLSAINTLARALLNDAAGNTFTDQLLLPFAQMAYRRINKSLGNIKSATYIQDNVLLIVSAIAAVDASAQVSITDATPPPNQLPVDLLVPLKVSERASGSTDDFQEMTDMTDEGGLPSQPQSTQLMYWEWRMDGIYFIGATQDTQIRLRYQAIPADVTSPLASVLLRDGQNTMALLTAAMAGLSRGSPLAANYKTQGDDALESMKDTVVHQMQNQTRRRRPYSSRNRSYPFL